MTSLTSGTTYQFRVYAVTQSGTGAGTDVVGQTEVSNGIRTLFLSSVINSHELSRLYIAEGTLV